MSASIRMWTLKLSAYGVCAVCLHVRENFNAPRGRREWCGENAAENAEIERVRERQKNMWLRVFLCELCVACVCVCAVCALCALCVRVSNLSIAAEKDDGGGVEKSDGGCRN